MNKMMRMMGGVSWSACIYVLAASFVQAQDAPKPAIAPATTQPNVTTKTPPPKMETIVVTADESILPTSRDLTSLYGTSMSILDTPRSVSEITVEQLKSRNIESVEQLGQFSSGTYTPNRYGLASVPVIRGDLGEVYQNGQRLRYNRNGFPVSFNAVEGVDLVKGPAPAPFSPSNQSGGYINFITKAPFEDAFHGDLSLQLGDLYFRPEGNPFRSEWNLDFGGPIIKDKLAYRVSYLGRQEDGYYQDTRNDSQDIFGALDFKPYTNIHMEFTGQYYADRYNEAIGLNRPTQALIDNGTYVTGNGSSFGTPGPGFAEVLSPTGTAHVYPYQSLNAANDSARSQVGLGQLITTINVDSDLDIVNSSFGEFNEHRKFSHYEYQEYQPDAISIENRTEIRYNFDLPYGDDPKFATKGDARDLKPSAPMASDSGSLHNDLNVGFTERYEYTKAYTEFFNEDVGSYDLNSNDPLQLPVANGGYQNGLNQFGYQQIPGTLYFANVQANTLRSTLLQLGPFYQHNIKFNPQWSFLFGGRLDLDLASANDPLTPGFQDSEQAISHSYNFSLSYKPVEWATTYVTYNYNQAYEGSYDSGGISPPSTPGGKIGVQDFRKESTLYEAGAKFDLLDHTLYGSVAGFYQKRNQNDRFGVNNAIEARGVELDASYQPDKHLSVTGNFTWIEENYNDVSPGEATLNYQDLYPAGYVLPDGTVGTGNGAPNFAAGPKGDYKVPGQPNILFNSYATYKLDCGLGVSVGPQVQGDQNANLYGTLVIPAQFEWNASIFYEQPHYGVKVDFMNFTDERNLTPTDPGFAGNDLVLYNEPFHMRATFHYKF